MREMIKLVREARLNPAACHAELKAAAAKRQLRVEEATCRS